MRDLKRLVKQMTLEQKLAQISQYNSVCLHIGTNGDVTGPASEFNFSKSQIQAVGSVLGVSGAKEVIEIQKEHIENDPNKIPMLFMCDVVHGYKTIYPVPLGLGARSIPTLLKNALKWQARKCRWTACT